MQVTGLFVDHEQRPALRPEVLFHLAENGPEKRFQLQVGGERLRDLVKQLQLVRTWCPASVYDGSWTQNCHLYREAKATTTRTLSILASSRSRIKFRQTFAQPAVRKTTIAHIYPFVAKKDDGALCGQQ